MNTPKYIIVHCSDSPFGNAAIIREWHKERGWNDIGYHFVILNTRPQSNNNFIFTNGAIECGRNINEIGAHCLGYNDKSIGICVIGTDSKDFTIEQMDILKKACLELCRIYRIPADNVLGHCETESGRKEGKTCPNFDVSAIRTYLKGRV